MTYNTLGQLKLTVVPGTSYTGLYAVDGSQNVVLTTENTTWKGSQHPCGAYWGTLVTTPVLMAYAIDGSNYIVQNSDFSYALLKPQGSTTGRSNLLTNGNLLLNPINASPSTVQNGWLWTIGAGTGTVTWTSPSTTIMGDGTNISRFGTTTIPTIAGITYTVTVDVSGTTCAVVVTTAVLGAGSVLLNVSSGIGTSLKFTFTATGTTSFLSFQKTAATASVVTNVSVL